MRRRELLAGLGFLPLTAQADPLPLHLAFLADTGTGSKGQYAVAAQLAKFQNRQPFDLILLGGDNIYTNGEISKSEAVFEKPYQSLLTAKVPFYAVLGNHDVRTNHGDDQVRYFKMPSRYYTFSRGSAQFFALDTNALEQNQLAWLDTQLQKSKARWKIVYGHHNVYSSSVYGVSTERVTVLSPILIKHQVALYLNGHEHCYERTIPQSGVVYITSGGGAETRPVKTSTFTAFSRATREFLDITITPGSIQVQAVDATGAIFDQVTLT